jgi:uncharacterized Zn-finger protein
MSTKHLDEAERNTPAITEQNEPWGYVRRAIECLIADARERRSYSPPACQHPRAFLDQPSGTDWCPDCGAIKYGAEPDYAWLRPRAFFMSPEQIAEADRRVAQEAREQALEKQIAQLDEELQQIDDILESVGFQKGNAVRDVGALAARVTGLSGASTPEKSAVVPGASVGGAGGETKPCPECNGSGDGPHAVCTCGANNWTTVGTVIVGPESAIGEVRCSSCGKRYPAETIVNRGQPLPRCKGCNGTGRVPLDPKPEPAQAEPAPLYIPKPGERVRVVAVHPEDPHPDAGVGDVLIVHYANIARPDWVYVRARGAWWGTWCRVEPAEIERFKSGDLVECVDTLGLEKNPSAPELGKRYEVRIAGRRWVDLVGLTGEWKAWRFRLVGPETKQPRATRESGAGS